MNSTLKTLPFLAATVAAAFAMPALAHDDERGLGDMVAQSDLVFRGVVENIEFALSNPGGQEGRRVPYTFVTYRVDSVLHGMHPGGIVTLRFIGGLNTETNRYMTSSMTPRFDIGDEDVLFVRGNDMSICPLVGSTDGRLRVIGGQVYTEMGHEVNLDGAGAIVAGPRHLLEEVQTTNVLGKTFTLDLGPEAIDGPSDAMPAENLTQRIAFASANAGPSLSVFINSDPAIPFEGPDMMPAAAPATRPGENRTATQTEGAPIQEAPLPVRRNNK